MDFQPSHSSNSFNIHVDSSPPDEGSSKPDDTALGRQKRRRTSTRDHAILEAAYQENSKPDKVERAILISQVALGQKEVQIWFQNRRQHDRRRDRMRPLLPHEAASHFRNAVPDHLVPRPPVSLHTASSTPNGSFSSTSSDEREARRSGVDEVANRNESRASSIHELLNPLSEPSSQTSPSVEIHSSQDSKQNATAQPRTHPMSLETLTNRDDSSPAPLSKLTVARQSLYLPPSNSPRLSMTLDGSVKVKTTSEPTPSPPKRLPTPALPVSNPNPLKRSLSALSTCTTTSTTSLHRDTSFGRSRDARRWEFYCDASARDSQSLSTQAESTTRGSAAGLIKLIRSQSDLARSHARARDVPLKPRLATGNLDLRRRNVAGTATAAAGEKRPKMVRAMTSLPRLGEQMTMKENRVVGLGLKRTEKKEGRGKAMLVRSPSSDSDKENRDPDGSLAGRAPLRRTQSSVSVTGKAARAILVEQSGENDGRTKAEGWALGEKERVGEFEVAEGLLSLSQGAW